MTTTTGKREGFASLDDADPIVRELLNRAATLPGPDDEGRVRALHELAREATRAAAPATSAGATWETAWARSSVGAWLATRRERRRYLLVEPGEGGLDSGVLPLGKVGMLAAGGGVGKTTSLLQLALCVAAGGGARWLRTFDVNEDGDVLVVLAEEEAEEAHRRVHEAAELLGLTPAQRARVAERLVVLPLAGEDVALTRTVDPHDKAGGLPVTELAGELVRKLESDKARSIDGTEREREWRLVVLDPLSRFAGADVETDNAAATRFVQVLETLVKVRGTPTVLVGHHTTKADRRESSSDDTGARGASGLSDGMRWHASMKSLPVVPGDYDVPPLVAFRVVKSNYTRAGIVRTLQRTTGGGLTVAAKGVVEAYEAAVLVERAKRKAEEKAAKDTATKAGKGNVTKASHDDALDDEGIG